MHDNCDYGARGSGRDLGSFVLPSGNSCNVYLDTLGHIRVEWDREPSPSWPRTDVSYYDETVTPAILRLVADATGMPVVGVKLLAPEKGVE
jgi:hypothetical protein